MPRGKHDGRGKKKITVSYKFGGKSLLLSSQEEKSRWSVDQTYQKKIRLVSRAKYTFLAGACIQSKKNLDRWLFREYEVLQS